jgi:hypothetical protein
MATTEVIESLTQVVQDCLEAKLQAGFDANAALSLDIAREVASAVQTKANEYTDVEIANVMSLISGGEVDLGPFTEFMNSVKTLIDGDENTEGYQIFELLVSDTAANKQTLINQTTTLAAIQQNLTTFQSTLADHEARITALEAAQHEPIDCEDCHDELLNIVKNAIGDACTDSQTTLNAYHSTTSASILASWIAELNPVNVITPVITSFIAEDMAPYDPANPDMMMGTEDTTYRYAFFVHTEDTQIDSINFSLSEEPPQNFVVNYFNPVARTYELQTNLAKTQGVNRTLTANVEYFDVNGNSLGTTSQVFNI